MSSGVFGVGDKGVDIDVFDFTDSCGGHAELILISIRYHSRMEMAKEGELLACDAGLFRIVDGKREFIEVSQKNFERLRLDAAAESRGRTRRVARKRGSGS